jgi:hypothetical protein
MRSLAFLVAVAAAACSYGAPPGFSNGNQWTLPLVDPLAGVLVTPVMLNGHGPYLFAIDPDVNSLIVDDTLAGESGASRDRGYGPHYVDKTDTTRQRFQAELYGIQLGNLTIERRIAMVVPRGTYAAGIRGVLGREVIADSLVFGFDRDRGLAFLTTQEGFVMPANATVLTWEAMTRKVNDTGLGLAKAAAGNFVTVDPTPRRLVAADVGGSKFQLHVNFESVPSALRETLWPKAGLQPIAKALALVDESGQRQDKDKLAIAPQVAVGSVSAQNVVFVPHVDKRWADELYDGELGLGFFDHYVVWANWDKKKLFVTPRGDVRATAAQRVARWPTLARCEHLACVQVTITDPLAGKPLAEGQQHPGVVVSIVRDGVAAGIPLEVVLAATPGAPGTALPELRVTLPAHADRVMEHLHAEFAGAKLEVVDASPFPRGCDRDEGCVQLVAP